MTTRSLSTISTLALTLTLALAPAPGALAGVPAGFSEVVVFATNSVDLKNDSVRVESGHVVVNEDGSTPTELSIGKDADLAGSFAVGLKGTVVTAFVVGHDLRLKQGATVGGDAYYNQVQIDGGAAILGTQITPVTLPFFGTLPDFPAAVPGTVDVTVPGGGSETLAAGDYADVTVGNNGTLVFSGGVYDLRSLKTTNWTKLLFEAPSEVRIADDFNVGKEAEVGSAPGAGVPASRIIFFVGGGSGNTVEIGMDSVVGAGFYAPNGKILVQQGTALTGVVAAQDVVISKNVTLALASAFNEPPEPQDDSASVLEGATVSVLDSGATSVLDNDDDPNADDTLTVTVPQVSGPDHGVLLLDSDGTFSYTHDGSENLADAFVYEVCDDGNPVLCATATVTIAVAPVNDPPTLDPIPDPAPILEDAGEQTVNLSGIAQGGDPPDHNNETAPPQFPLVVGASSDNPALIPHPTVTYSSPDSVGSLAYTPVAEQSGSAVITVVVMDQGGTANGGVDTIQRTFTVEVTPVNDPPVIDDQSVTTDSQTLIVIDLTGTDIEGDNLTYALITPFSNPALGSLTDFEQGPPTLPANEARVTFLPSGDGSTGSGNFVYEVCDDGSPPGPECDQATVTITVVAFNPAPFADSQGFLDNSDSPLAITLTGNDPGPLPDNGLDFSLAVPPQNGNLVGLPVNDVPGCDVSCGTPVQYFPTNPGGPDSFVFRVCDNDTPVKCAFGVVTINTTEPLNNPPAADDQAVDTNGDVDLPITLTASDPDAGDTLTFSIFVPPTEGVLTGTPPAVVYDPNGAGDLEDMFVFEVCDDGTPVLCDNGTVFINRVAETTNDPPTPQSDSIRVEPGGTTTTLFPVGTSLLTNDSDPNGDNLVVTTTPVSGPSHGSLTLQSDGTFSYTHADDGSTTDQFEYEVCDDGTPVECATATVFIEVELASIVVDVAIVGSGSGSVTSSPAGIDCPFTSCSASFDTATDLPVVLQVMADPGSNFGGWSGSGDCANGQIEVAANASCVATFTEAPPPGTPVEITLGVDGMGTLTGAPTSTVPCDPDVPGCSTYPFGTRVVLSATPFAGWSFAGYTGTGDCLDGELDGTIDATCIAVFDPPPAVQWTVTVPFAGDGSGVVTIVGKRVCDDDCSAVFGDLETAVLSARPDAGSTFGGFDGECGTEVGFTATILVDDDKTCTVTFDQD